MMLTAIGQLAMHMQQQVNTQRQRLPGKPTQGLLLLSLVLLASVVPPTSAGIDVTIHGGYFDSRFTSTYTDVAARGCFGGLDLGTCKPPNTEWLQDYMAAYNSISHTGTYCLSCCSNSAPYVGPDSPDKDADTWDLSCDLASNTQRRFVNMFGYVFIFLRNAFEGDMDMVQCPIPRASCTYDAAGAVVGACTSDGTYLHGYELQLGVRMVGAPLGGARRQVTYCSVTTIEFDVPPNVFNETLVLIHDNTAPYHMSPWWGILITLVLLAGLSGAARWVRDDSCIICGHRLIWLQRVCVMCRYYGYTLPSEPVLRMMADKRAIADAADANCDAVPPEVGVTLRAAGAKLQAATGTLRAATGPVVAVLSGTKPPGSKLLVSPVRTAAAAKVAPSSPDKDPT